MPKDSKRFTLSNAFNEFVRHPSPFVLLVICVSCWIGRSLEGGMLSLQEWCAVAGVISYWPFQEWWMHKYLLHLPPIELGKMSIEMDFAKKHRLHHEDPSSLPLIFLPIPTIAGSLVLFSCFAGVISGWDIAFMLVFMGTASFSTILYEWTHYLTHCRYPPKSEFYKRIWKQHRWHHYKNEKYWYSFTIPHIDEWMGTGPEVGSVAKSPTARNLGRQPDGKPLES
jgi:hypothetical protein